MKNSSDLLYVILRVSSTLENHNSNYYFSIKYRMQEPYDSDDDESPQESEQPETQGKIYLPSVIALIISIPNLMLYIFNKICCKNENALFVHLFLDITFHLGILNLISKYVYLKENIPFILGIVFLVLYAIIMFCYLVYEREFNKEKYTGISCLFKKLSICKTRKSAINENAILPPELKIKVRAFHKESREKLVKYGMYEAYDHVELLGRDDFGDLNIYRTKQYSGIEELEIETKYSEWKRVDRGGGKVEPVKLGKYQRQVITTEEREIENFNKELIYKYNSWQDNTNLILNNKSNMLFLKFKFEIKLDFGAKNSIERMKNEMEKEAKFRDTETEVTEIFTIPNFKEEILCRYDKNCFLDLLYIILGISSIFTGFLIFLHFFAVYEVKFVEVTIIKLVSSTNIYKNGYMMYAPKTNKINIKEDKSNNEYMMESLV